MLCCKGIWLKKNILSELVENAPEGATHINYGECSYTCLISYPDSHFIWIGIKHGGWSIKIPYPYKNIKKAVNIKEYRKENNIKRVKKCVF